MLLELVIVFVKQKTAYDMRISDWSSDVCSSDLRETSPGEGCVDLGNAWIERPELSVGWIGQGLPDRRNRGEDTICVVDLEPVRFQAEARQGVRPRHKAD